MSVLFLVEDRAGRPLFVNACNFLFVSLHGSLSCVHFTIKENNVLRRHIFLGCTVYYRFVIFLFFISKGRMGESTSFNSFAGRVIMTPMMLKFYRGPHECVPCGCAYVYEFYVCCRVFRSLPSIVQNVVLSPSSPSGNTPVLFPPLIRFCITPMLPNLIVVLNW